MSRTTAIIASIRRKTDGEIGTVTLCAEFDELTVSEALSEAIIEAINELPNDAIKSDPAAAVHFEVIHTRQMEACGAVVGLENVATADLLAELESRSDIFVLGMTAKCDNQHIIMRFKGGRLPARGMIEEMRYESERATAVHSYLEREAQAKNQQEES